MVFYLLGVLALAFYGCKVYPRGVLSRNYLSVKNTTALKGAFLLLVFSRHFKEYVGLYSPYDQPFRTFDSALGQLVVVMFFFYSGYGVYTSIRKKGEKYIKEFPVKRVLITFINFAVAVLLYIIVDTCLGIHYSPFVYLFSFIGYTSVGNSCWYIFAVLWLYIITAIAFAKTYKYPKLSITLVSILTVIYVLLVMRLKTDNAWWYNTAICYPFGMWYAYFKKDIEEVFYNRHDIFRVFFAVSVIGTIVMTSLKDIFIFYEFSTLFFAMSMVCLTMKIDFYNIVTYKIGENLFIMFIMQRLPMIILEEFNITYYMYTTLIATILITYLIACVFRLLYNALDDFILDKIYGPEIPSPPPMIINAQQAAIKENDAKNLENDSEEEEDDFEEFEDIPRRHPSHPAGQPRQNTMAKALANADQRRRRYNPDQANSQEGVGKHDMSSK